MAPPRRNRLTHLKPDGAAHMVDIGGKPPTRREAVASARVTVGRDVLALLVDGKLPKGDAFATARIAGIAAAKRTDELIPLCHALPVEAIEVELRAEPPEAVIITATVRTTGRTGVEMEAMTAVSVAALTLYDMCKSASKAIEIGPIRLESKTGGKSGTYRRG